MNRMNLIAGCLMAVAGCDGSVFGDDGYGGRTGGASASASTAATSSSGGTGGSGGSGGVGGADGDTSAPSASTELVHNAQTRISSMVCDEEALFWAEPKNQRVMSVGLNSSSVREAGAVPDFVATNIFLVDGSIFVSADSGNARIAALPVSGGAPTILVSTPHISAFAVDSKRNVYWGDGDSVWRGHVRVAGGGGPIRDMWADDDGLFWSNSAGYVMHWSDADGLVHSVGQARTRGEGVGLGLVRAMGQTVAAGGDGLVFIGPGGASRTVWPAARSVAAVAPGVAWVDGAAPATLHVMSGAGLISTIDTEPDVESAVSCGAYLYWWTSEGKIWRRLYN